MKGLPKFKVAIQLVYVKHVITKVQLWTRATTKLLKVTKLEFLVSLNIFNCHINMQWGRTTSSTNISYGPSPTIQIEGEQAIQLLTKHLIKDLCPCW